VLDFSVYSGLNITQIKYLLEQKKKK